MELSYVHWKGVNHSHVRRSHTVHSRWPTASFHEELTTRPNEFDSIPVYPRRGATQPPAATRTHLTDPQFTLHVVIRINSSRTDGRPYKECKA